MSRPDEAEIFINQVIDDGRRIMMTTQAGIRADKMRRMAKPPMVQKTYRVPEALYEAAMEKAEEQQENLSDVIRKALERYVKKSS